MSDNPRAVPGNNTGQKPPTPKTADHLDGPQDAQRQHAVERLRNIVERIERLLEEKKALSSDIRDIYAEGKSAGFDVKVLRQLIGIRAKDAATIEEQETMLDIYRRALGM